MLSRQITLFVGLSLIASQSYAGIIAVEPVTYSMLNGSAGTYNYFDDEYDGSGDNSVAGAPLTGGTGDLTDGVIPAGSWNSTGSQVGATPWVGWRGFNPTITFNFGATYNFFSARFYFDDSGVGGVAAPSSVTINSAVQAVTDPIGIDPFDFTYDLSGVSADTLTVTLTRSADWVFLSEVDFLIDDGVIEEQSVPTPATLALFGLGLVGLGWKRRKQA